MVNVYYDKDVDPSILRDEVIAIIGYGSQGRNQGLNLRDSGIKVIVGCRPGKSEVLAKSDGFETYPVDEAARRATIIYVLLPDMVHREVYEKHIKENLEPGKALCFSHGFSIHYKQVAPPPFVDVIMVAPKGPGPLVRENYLRGSGVPALIAVKQDYSGRAKQRALGIARAIGATRVGVIETTFKDETESDLIGEQTVLVGGLMELIKAGFEVLVEAGYPPELAYFEACNEAKLIMDLIYKSGITGMLKAVSDTAKYGGLVIGPKVIDEHVKENMRRVVEEVKSGVFAGKWIEEYEKGAPTLKRLMEETEKSTIEVVGKKIRKMAGIEE
ncbi:MAG: ketol-acid reductoisomerase [Nitrososphaeria archaeon]|nr:ketol-acid reductoisomerase [Nitrososphaeria archaeon]